MIQPEEQRIMKIMEILQQTNLFTGEELTLAEDYMLGREKWQEVEKLAFRDLSGIPAEKANYINQLAGRGVKEEARRLAQFLFAAGQSTSMSVLMADPSYFFYNNIQDMFPSEPEKRAAVYAPKIVRGISLRSMPNLIKLADNDPGNLKKAIAYQKDKTLGGRLVLLGAYFATKYPDVGQDGVLLEEQDIPLMKEYEDEVVKGFSTIYTDPAVLAHWKEIKDAVNEDRVDQRILKMAETKSGFNQYMIQLYGGISYMNYLLSPRLKNVVKICLRANLFVTQNIMMFLDVRGDRVKRIGEYDEIFGIEPREYISWAAQQKALDVLGAQCRRNREEYLNYMSQADFEVYNNMMSILQNVDPKKYEEVRKADASRQQVKLIDAFVEITESSARGSVRAYLQGETDDMAAFCAYGDRLLDPNRKNSYGVVQGFWKQLDSYRRGFGYDALTNKCIALLMLGSGFEKYVSVFSYNYVKAEDVDELFSAADSVKLPLRYQLAAYSDIDASYCLGPDGVKVYEDAALEIFRKYLADRREEMTAAVWEADSAGRILGLKLFSEDPKANKAEILRFAQDTAKAVKEALLELLYRQTDWEQDIIALLSSKKAADRDVAVRVLTKWDSAKYAPLFAEALEKEKNGKVRALLDSALNAESGQSGERNISQEDLVKEIHKGNKKRTIAWAYETPFSKVHKKDGGEAAEEYLQAILLSYSGMSPCGISPSAALLAETLREDELAVYVNELFDKWLEAGAESKKRWVLYAAAIHGGNAIVEKMRHQIQEWPQAARGAIASEAVRALALSPRPQALLIVDGISRKFKFKQVKAAAVEALEFAASQLGITKEELADRIVPDLGFDEKMERHFDYGERTFTVTITTALEVEVFDESGKKLKNLPAPGKRDDEAKAAAAYEEFKQMKKQMKATVGSQKMRLDMALSTERRWSAAAWKDLFVKNPIMHQFAIGLIWGVYEGGKLKESFRYMEDGSFNTEDEDEFALPEENASIGLVHPIELSKESLEAWKQQLEDYEIAQPIEQLDRAVYRRTKEEEEQKCMERFGGCIVNDLSLAGKLMGDGWYRGSTQDGGGFYTFYREDPDLSLGVELHFSGSYVGGSNEDVTVYEARFYEAGTIKRGSYMYDEAEDKNSYFLKDVPERYFSEIVRQIARATAASKDRDENWRHGRR
ncbi:MAG: DUF4132 domain-containing protein [Eubacterium sp.]|nr:DUF4132 domain-containing protein [Eubacterium sp.]MCM1218710.1 DUF4132 domain-containing protein [Lachnospiraceae bacterium]MCM1237979.1 DUF4132 domain-containing protein [Lachnospiraceae bacterium]